MSPVWSDLDPLAVNTGKGRSVAFSFRRCDFPHIENRRLAGTVYLRTVGALRLF
jgi:hypothetical protein